MDSKLGVATSVIGVLGSFITSLFGGWTEGLMVLCLFMLIDFITGIMAAALCKSTKTPSGALSSNEIFKGIIRKVVILIIVVVGAQLDRVVNTTYIKDTVVIAYIVNETISIIENAGLIGLPIPSVITKIIDVLSSKAENTPNMNELDNK